MNIKNQITRTAIILCGGRGLRLGSISKKIPKSLAVDVIRYSIKECNLAIPNSKIMEEIYKTFVASRPGPKSCVTWSRADKEDSSGMIKYKEGNLIISKR